MHPKLLQEYSEFCDIREQILKKQRSIGFEDILDFYPVKLLPLCDLLNTKDENLKVFPHLIWPVVIIPQEKEEADNAFQKLSRLHHNDQNACGGGQAFKYIISELIDNVYQHSRFTRAYAMVNKDSSEGFIDLCILDNGITIPKNIFGYGLIFEKEFESIIEVINGLSTKPEAGRGMGLGSTIRILLDGLRSEVFLVSSLGGLYLDKTRRISYSLTQKMRLDGYF